MRVVNNLMLAANRLWSRLACLYRYCSQNITSLESVWFCDRDPCEVREAFGGIFRIDRLSAGPDSRLHYASVSQHGGRVRNRASTFFFGDDRQSASPGLYESFYTARQRLVLLAAGLLRLDIFDLAWAVFKSRPVCCQGSGEG